MSQENVEIVRRGYTALGRSEPEPLDAFLREHLAPGFELQSRFLGQVFKGIDGVRQFISELRETWEDYAPEPVEFIDLGDHVAVVTRQAYRGASSGALVAGEVTMLWTIEDSKLIRGTVFSSKAEALEAVGLSE